MHGHSNEWNPHAFPKCKKAERGQNKFNIAIGSVLFAIMCDRDTEIYYKHGNLTLGNNETGTTIYISNPIQAGPN